MQPTPYVFLNGTAREALTTWGKIFGATPEIMSAADMPPGTMDIPEDRRDWVMHGSLRIGEGVLMASDNIDGTSDAMAGCSVWVAGRTADEALGMFDALAEGGEVTMPFAPTFWSAGFGTCVDRFGIRWMVDTEASGD